MKIRILYFILILFNFTILSNIVLARKFIVVDLAQYYSPVTKVTHDVTDFLRSKCANHEAYIINARPEEVGISAKTVPGVNILEITYHCSPSDESAVEPINYRVDRYGYIQMSCATSIEPRTYIGTYAWQRAIENWWASLGVTPAREKAE